MLGFGFEVRVFREAPADSGSSRATLTESLKLLPDWFEVLEEPDLMEFQVCFYLFPLRTLGTSQQVLQSSPTAARGHENWEEQRLLMSLIWPRFIPPQRHYICIFYILHKRAGFA